MKKNRTIAKLSGWTLIVMAILAGFSFGFAFPKIYNVDQLDFAQSNLIENLQLYKIMLTGILIVILLDILVSWSLFVYFKSENRKLAFVSCILRIIYTFIFAFATFHLVKNLGQTINNNTLIIGNYRSFYAIWSIGLIIFGIHLLVIGVLMKLHKLVPGILWYLTILAGVSYFSVHLLKTTSPQIAEFNNTLETILSLPMALGELGLAIWLIVKGGKWPKNQPLTKH